MAGTRRARRRFGHRPGRDLVAVPVVFGGFVVLRFLPTVGVLVLLVAGLALVSAWHAKRGRHAP